MTEWRTIPGYENYEVSHAGYVRRRDTGYRIRRNAKNYVLYMHGKKTSLSPADLVALAWPESGPTPAPAPGQKPAITPGPTPAPTREPSPAPRRIAAATLPIAHAQDVARLRIPLAELDDAVETATHAIPLPVVVASPTSRKAHSNKRDAYMRAYLRPEHPLSLHCPWHNGDIRAESEWDWAGIL